MKSNKQVYIIIVLQHRIILYELCIKHVSLLKQGRNMWHNSPRPGEIFLNWCFNPTNPTSRQERMPRLRDVCTILIITISPLLTLR